MWRPTGVEWSGSSLSSQNHSVPGVSHIQTITRRGKPEDIIPEFTVREGIDLVVMANPTSDGGIAGFFFGGASLKFLKKLTCSLLAVKPDGFVSPVRVPAD